MEIVNILSPYCVGVHDVFGQDDINALLRKHPDIEKTHYKLWLTSTAVLQRILHHGSAVWNKMTKADVERTMSLYVQTDAHEVAAKLLREYNYCILSGIPGIGKTTLAHVLITRLMEEDYELITVRENVQEAFELLDHSKKQVIYYDDFLGQSSLDERLHKNEDQGIVRLLLEARRSKNTKVILTTREYILEKAKSVYEPLRRGGLDLAKCIVKVEDYTRGRKARILYNHVYFSELSRQHALALLQNKAYKKIIDHQNYNPRVIEWMTVGGGAVGISAGDYVKKFIEALNNPKNIWDSAFDDQLDDNSKIILYCMGSVEGGLELEELRQAWAAVKGIEAPKAISLDMRSAFMKSLARLEGTFLRTEKLGSTTIIGFHNPSIKDYVRKRIVDDPQTLQLLVEKCMFFEQIECLVKLDAEGRIGSTVSRLVPNDLALRKSIERTLNSKPSGYQVTTTMSGMTKVMQGPANIGQRLGMIASWAKDYKSKELLSAACDLAEEMIRVGEVARVATPESCDLLREVVQAKPQADRMAALVFPLVQGVGSQIASSSSSDDWQKWSVFASRNEALFDEESMNVWIERAEVFCLDEIDAIVSDAATQAEAEQRYENVQVIAKEWGISIPPSRLNRIEERIGELAAEEEGDPDDSDWWPAISGPESSENDGEIERLFESLDDRPNVE